jgi:hypothetical protein
LALVEQVAQPEETTEMRVLILYFLPLLPLEVVLVLQILVEHRAVQMAVTAVLVAAVVIQEQAAQEIPLLPAHLKVIMVVMLLPLALIMVQVVAVDQT